MMNDISESSNSFLSIKIGVIIAAIYYLLQVGLKWGLFETSATVCVISGILWCSVWDFSKTEGMSIFKKYILLVIHVLGTGLAPFVFVVANKLVIQSD